MDRGWAWLWAIGKTGYQCAEPWDSQGGTSGSLEEHLSPVTLGGAWFWGEERLMTSSLGSRSLCFL